MKDELDRLAALAAAESRPKLDEERRREMARRAVLAGQGRHRARRERRVWIATAGAIAMAAAVLLALRLTSSGPATTASSSDYELRLATGDEVLARGDVRFEVQSQTPALRSVRLDEGAMLFDVAPLGPGSRFEVVTGDTTVRVLGTVFVVEATSAGTSVHVYEGRVEVARGADVRVLVAGERHRPELASPRSASLANAARERARRRTEAPAARDTRETSSPGWIEEAPSSLDAVEETAVEEAGGARRAPRETVPPREPRDEYPSADRGPGSPVAPQTTPETNRPNDTSTPDFATERGTGPEPGVEPLPNEVPSTTQRQSPPEDDSAEDGARAARAALEMGDAERALALARSGDGDPTLLLVEADALRILGRTREAARAYDRVLDAATRPHDRSVAGFVGAELWYRRFREPEHATRVLLESGALDDATLRERALVLRADLAVATHDTEALADTCRLYLAEYPAGPRASWMRAHQAR
jgi:hypothetical protein